MLLVTLLVAVIFTVEKCSETLCKFRRCLFLLVVNAGGREWLFNRLGREGREGRDAREGREKGRKGGTGGRDGKHRREGRTGRKRGKYLTGKYFCISSFYFFKIHIMLYFGIEGLRFKCSNWNQDQQSFKWNQNIFSFLSVSAFSYFLILILLVIGVFICSNILSSSNTLEAPPFSFRQLGFVISP